MGNENAGMVDLAAAEHVVALLNDAIEGLAQREDEFSNELRLMYREAIDAMSAKLGEIVDRYEL